MEARFRGKPQPSQARLPGKWGSSLSDILFLWLILVFLIEALILQRIDLSYLVWSWHCNLVLGPAHSLANGPRVCCTDAAITSCLWLCNNFMVSVGIKEEFVHYVHNAELGPTSKISAFSISTSQIPLLRNLNIFLMSLQFRLTYMIIHLPCL